MRDPVIPSKVRLDALRIACNLIRFHEGFRERAYLCPAGKPTIGYGFTRYKSGRAVTLLDETMPQSEADALLEAMVADIIDTLDKDAVVLAECPYALAAIVDFCFNFSVGRFRQSTLAKRLREGNLREAGAEIMRWNKANGRVLAGLVKRREAEAALIALCR